MDRREFIKSTPVVGTVGSNLLNHKAARLTPAATPEGPQDHAQTPAKESEVPNRLVGAHYYPWYETHAGHQDWVEQTPSEPVLGEYASENDEVITQHLQWSLEHGISWWSISWWGPESSEDRVLQEAILKAEGFSNINFSILYETTGRLGEFAFDLDRSDAQNRFIDDIAYLSDTYFGQSNYLHIDGQPVVFVYVSNLLTGDIEGTVEQMTDAIGVKPYIVADIPLGKSKSPDSAPIIKAAGALSTYNPYEARPDIEDVFHTLYQQKNKILHVGADVSGVDYIPTVLPGYNDTAIPTAEREDNPILEASPERFERVCSDVAPHLNDAVGVLITSFNEWYENTQIEPHEDVGTEYLEITMNELATGITSEFDPDGITLQFDFNKTVKPVEVDPGSSDHRDLSVTASKLQFLADDEEMLSYDIGNPPEEPLPVQGAYGTASDEARSWRWFGGPFAQTTLFVQEDLSGIDKGIIYGEPMVSNEIEADIYLDGIKADHIEFGARDWSFDGYEFSLTSVWPDAEEDSDTESDSEDAAETEEDADAEDTAPEETDDAVPGFGAPTAAASLGGAGYLLRRRLSDTETDES